MNYPKEIARSLITIGAVGFTPKQPITFKSGIISPVYIDNRRFPFWPLEWEKVIKGFKYLIDQNKIEFDVIAGVEAAGIPHSAALGFFLQKPSVFVRKEAKDHGLKKRVEGGEIAGKKVILVEDLITTGNSSLSVVEAIRREGGLIEDCLIIVTYGFIESTQAFKNANVKLHALTSFPIILEQALIAGKINKEDKSIIEDWLNSPHEWGKKDGYE